MSGAAAASENSYELSVEPLENIRNLEVEPNDSKEEATMATDNEIRGYISKAKDKDYFYLKYSKRVNLDFSVKGVRDGVIKVSVTDPLGYVLKSRTVRGDALETLSEMIDGGGYLIIEAVETNFDNPYEIEVNRK